MPSRSTADIATEVDRLVIGVHRAVMSRHRSSFGDLFDAIDVPSPGQLYDLAEFVADGTCTVEVARRRFSYEPDDAAGAMVGQLHQQGLLDDRSRPAGDLVDVVDTILAARAEAAADLWPGELGSALRGAIEALGCASGTLVDAFRSLPEPPEPPHRLHHLLTGMRYARLDAHISAWETAGLAAAEIVALNSAAAGELVSPGPQRLVARGWLTNEGAATAEGDAARAMIETATNCRCDAMVDAVADRAGWFATLRALPPQG